MSRRLLSIVLTVLISFSSMNSMVIKNVEAEESISINVMEIQSFNGHYYWFSSEEMKWNDAVSFCSQNGGHLVTINSQEENDLIYSTFVKEKDTGIIIGASDLKEEGKWQWVDGEKFEYTNWDPGEPNNEFDEDYALMKPNGVWNDGHCDREDWYFVCEWDKYEDIETSIISSKDFASDRYNISVGDYIVMGNYLGENISWRCVAIDENGPLMLSDKILCYKSFDAKGNYGNYYRNKEGTNYWDDCCLKHWLNSNGEVNWSGRKSVPNTESVFNGYNTYESEDGFLSSFSEEEKKSIKTVSQKTYLNNLDSNLAEGGTTKLLWSGGSFESAISSLDYSDKWYYTSKDTIFVPGPEQIKAVYDNLGLEYVFADSTDSAKENDDSNYQHTNHSKYWLRLPANNGMSYENCGIVNDINTENGGYDIYYSSVSSVINGNQYQNIGVRPAFYLNDETYTGKVYHTNPLAKEFTLGRDNNSFVHNNQNSSDGFYNVVNYDIKDPYIKAKLINMATSSGETASILEQMYGKWGGSCYGIAEVMGLCYLGGLRINEISDSSADNFYSINPKPYNNKRLSSVINYYYLTQFLDKYGIQSNNCVSTYFKWNSWWLDVNNYENLYSNSDFLKKLLDEVQSKYTVLLGYMEKYKTVDENGKEKNKIGGMQY